MSMAYDVIVMSMAYNVIVMSRASWRTTLLSCRLPLSIQRYYHVEGLLAYNVIIMPTASWRNVIIMPTASWRTTLLWSCRRLLMKTQHWCVHIPPACDCVPVPDMICNKTLSPCLGHLKHRLCTWSDRCSPSPSDLRLDWRRLDRKPVANLWSTSALRRTEWRECNSCLPEESPSVNVLCSIILFRRSSYSRSLTVVSPLSRPSR